MRDGAISDQARLLAAVRELDASPAPATEIAADRLAGVADALVRSDFSGVCLGDGEAWITTGPRRVAWRRVSEVPLWSTSVRGRGHPVVALHDRTGLLITGRPSCVGSLGSLPPTIDIHLDPSAGHEVISHLHLPPGYEHMVGAPVDFDTHSFLATYRAGGDFSDGEVLLLDQLRPVASRLLRRSTASRLVEASASAWGLSPREAEVFAFAGMGLSLPSIASILGLSVPTVRTQMAKAYQKTAVRSRAAVTSALLDVVEPTALQQASRRLVPGEKGPLTGRELTVLRIASTGRTTSAIASVIGISTETVKTHLANVYRKLGVQNRSQALLFVGTTTADVGSSERVIEGPDRGATRHRPVPPRSPLDPDVSADHVTGRPGGSRSAHHGPLATPDRDGVGHPGLRSFQGDQRGSLSPPG